MRIVHVASEVAPFAQSGGLADVLAGLPPALAATHRLDVAVVCPLYRGTEAKLATAGATLDAGTPITVTLGPHMFAASLRTTRIAEVTYGFVDCAALYDRAGSLYGPTATTEFPDNHLRFGVLGKVALEHGHTLVGGKPIDVLHVHDWQGAPAAIFAKAANAPVSIITTVHNLAFRGIFPKPVMTDLGLPWSMFTHQQLEFYDQISLLKGAMAYSDVVTTVSPTYAHEILTPAFGEALDGFLQWDVKRLLGIVNGIDPRSWDPASDAALPAHFSATKPDGKAKCRAALASEFGLAIDDSTPLIAAISRMASQKGLDLVADVAPQMHRLGAKLIVLGSGEPALEARFKYLADAFKDTIAVHIGFDINLSRRIYAGSDLFVMPSRFEPCGLGQLYAMRYGSVPIVHATGGLRDTVNDPGDDAELARGHGTGFRFEATTPAALLASLERAVALFRKPAAFAAIRRAAMSRDSSWTASAHQYVQIYRSLRAIA
ncbi:MAG TPA: glycogen synthase GlgA [Kofleriaceae bacterium]|nr:glycogen synthase GlgA [Kofleriaceae bacterium]